MKHKLRTTTQYNQTYRQIIGGNKITFLSFQSVTHVKHAPVAPDQPIKASTTYRLVRSNRSLTLNLKDKYATN